MSAYPKIGQAADLGGKALKLVAIKENLLQASDVFDRRWKRRNLGAT